MTAPARARYPLLLVPLLAASCAGLDRVDQGNLQPQTVSGPCDVKKFFLLAFRSVPVELTSRGGGQACTFTLLNPDLQIVLTGALITRLPAHGQASAVLTTGNRQAAITYLPQPGYTGPDTFSVTLEPSAIGMTISVNGGR